MFAYYLTLNVNFGYTLRFTEFLNIFIFRMPKITFNNIIASSLDKRGLSQILDIGKQPELSKEERDAILDHRMGPQSHLLKEGFITHKTSLIITKSIDEDLDIAEFVIKVLECCHFKLKVFIGMSKIVLNIMIYHVDQIS